MCNSKFSFIELLDFRRRCASWCWFVELTTEKPSSHFRGRNVCFKYSKHKSCVFSIEAVRKSQILWQVFLCLPREDYSLGHISDVYSSCQGISCKFYLTENERRSGVLSTNKKAASHWLSAFPWLDSQVTSADKLRFDLASLIKTETPENNRRRTNIIAVVSCWLQISLLSSVCCNGLLITSLLKIHKSICKKRKSSKRETNKHILISIQCQGGVIDSIINHVIFMASAGTSNAMTSIISLLKLHSLYSPLQFSNTQNHFSWESFFFFSTCCFSASPKSSVTSNSLTLYVGHLS